MLTGTKGAATMSPCGRYRWTLTRSWDKRPSLVVVMFNPSTADAREDDPTIRLLCHIASHHGYGAIEVVNGIPLRSPTPTGAVAMTLWEDARDWDSRDRLQDNVATIRKAVANPAAGGVLLAWGALAARCPAWFDHVLEQISEALPPGRQLLCLGRTKDGFPLHPLARGRMKVRPDAPLIPWSTM